jgi:signal transduction histidine kinase
MRRASWGEAASLFYTLLFFSAAILTVASGGCGGNIGELPLLIHCETLFTVDKEAFSPFRFDIENDGTEEVCIYREVHKTAFAGQPEPGRYNLTIFDSNVRNVVEQVNFPHAGRVSIHRRPNSNSIGIGFAYIEGDRLNWREYSLSGQVLRDFSICKLEDRNNNGTWNGSVSPAHFIKVNDDAEPDPVFIVSASYDLYPRSAIALDGVTGERLWEFNVGSCITLDFSVFDDVDGDGYDEIFLATSACDNGASAGGYDDLHSYAILLDRQGHRVWDRKIGEKFSAVQNSSVLDFDGDGVKEIVFLKQCHLKPRIEDDAIIVLDGATGKIKKYLAGSLQYYKSIHITDLDQDGKPDLIALTRDGRIIAYDNSLEVKNSLDPTAAGPISKIVHVGDINGVGRPEILAFNTEAEAVVLNDKLEVIARGHLSQNLRDPDYSEVVPSDSHQIAGGSLLLYTTGNIFRLSLSPNLARSILDYWPIAAALVLAAVAGVFLRTQRKSAREHRHCLLAENALDGDLETGIIIFDKNGRPLRVNEACLNFISVTSGTATNALMESDDPCVARLRAMLADLESNPIQSTVQDSILLERPDGTIVVNLIARRTVNEKGSTIGYLASLKNASAGRAMQVAVENVEIGQEVLHKVKTLLSVYKNDVYLLQQAHEKRGDEQLAAALREMVSVSYDITRISKSYLTLSKLKEPELREADLNALASRVTAYMARHSENGPILRTELEESLPPIGIDAGQIESLLCNLIENAIKATGAGGKVTISTALFRRLPDGRSVDVREFFELSVSDNGCGIEERYLEKVFEPAFSLFQSGAGLGLNICRRIAENHGGEITITSKPGRGTVVTVRLPYGR